MEKSLIIEADNIPSNVRLILKKGRQSSLVSQAMEKYETIKTLARKLNVDRSTIYCWKKEWWFMQVKYLRKIFALLNKDLNEINSSIVGIKDQSRITVFLKKKLPFEVPIELIAHLQGDGSVRKRDGSCSYINEQSLLVDSFINVVRKIFNTPFNTCETNGCIQVNLPAVIGKILVSKFGGFGSKEFVIPNIKNESNIKKYLRAIFDDEGSVIEDKKKYRYLSLKLCNSAALRKIKRFLFKLGINSHIYTYKNELRISGFQNILLFARKVNFTHPLQKEKLKKLLNNYKLKIW
jgi:intein-encoded DNA endonuclease-like protein